MALSIMRGVLCNSKCTRNRLSAGVLSRLAIAGFEGTSGMGKGHSEKAGRKEEMSENEGESGREEHKVKGTRRHSGTSFFLLPSSSPVYKLLTIGQSAYFYHRCGGNELP